MALRFDQIELSGSNDSEKPIIQANGHQAQISTAYGYIAIGPGNSTYSHFYTDRAKYYFSRGIIVDQGIISSFNEDLHLKVNDDANTVMTLSKTSPYNVGIGTTSPSEKLHIAGGSANIKLVDTSWKSSSGTQLGPKIDFHLGGNSSEQAQALARIQSIDRYEGAFDGALAFYTLAGGTLYERMRIEDNGNVGIGTTSPTAKTDIRTSASSGATNKPTFRAFGYDTDSYFEVNNNANNSANVKLTRSDAATMFSIDGHSGTTFFNGNVGIGTTSPSQKLDVSGTTKTTGLQVNTTSTAGKATFSTAAFDIPAFYIEGESYSVSATIEYGFGNVGMQYKSNYSSGGTVVEFKNSSGSTVGSISSTSTTTAYNTSSDYRLKENVIELTDGIERIKQLQPKRFNFIEKPEKTVDGFIAHEAQEIVPEAVTGEKDGIDWQGNPDYQGIDQAKLVPLLTAALQEAITKIENLESRIQILENQ